jgi:hypothetical protein
MPMITKVLYRDCGLIMACFKGYIELLDGVDFSFKGKWDNKIEISNGKKPAKKPPAEVRDEMTDVVAQPERKIET